MQNILKYYLDMCTCMLLAVIYPWSSLNYCLFSLTSLSVKQLLLLLSSTLLGYEY